MSYFDGEEYYIEQKGVYDEIMNEAIEKIKNNLNKEVGAYISENTNKLREAKETIKLLMEEKTELLKQVKDADKIREEIKAELLRAMWDDVKPGDTVWFIRTEQLYGMCHVCKGTGKVKAVTEDGIEVITTCPHCSYGRIENGVKYTTYSKQLSRITRTISIDGREIQFQIGGEWYDKGNCTGALCIGWNDRKAFRTKEEAEAEIARFRKGEGDE